MKDILLSCEDISLSLNGISIIENINLSLYRGEFHLLLDKNGAGKTTMANILSGIYPYGSYKGSIYYKNEKLRLRIPKDALRKHIVTIHQDICLFEDMTIAENLYANLPPDSALKSFTSPDKKIRMANNFFAKHDFPIDSSLLVNQCSQITKRKIELLRLYLMQPELLILDEPVAIVSNYDMEYFLNLISYFKEKGVTILCISYNYEAFLHLVDHISIFREEGPGYTIGQSDIHHEDVMHLLVKDFCQSRYPKINVKKGEEVLCAEKLSNGKTIKDISFTLSKGEILGFFGGSGSGRDSLSKTLFGLEPCHSGTIYIDRLPARITSPENAIDLGIAYITDDRNNCGLFQNLDLLENVNSVRGSNYKSFWTRTHFEQKRYERYADKMNLSLSPSAIAKHLSGGEQQKLILMRWLMSSARIFIFNEPTQSIDIPSRIDVYNMFNDLLLKGASILLFSSNLEELIGVCDRVIFIKQGLISGEVSRQDDTRHIENYI